MPNMSGGTPVNANYIAKFASSTSINDSVIYQNGTNVGIGTDNPQENLTLAQDSNIVTEMQVPTNITYGFQTTGKLPAGNYYFVVAASDGIGWTKATTEILVVLGVKDNAILLTWDAVVGATIYRVYRALTPGGPYKFIETNTNSFDYTSDGLFSTTGVPPTATTAYTNKVSASSDSWINGGNVGIGTTSPQTKLDVNGAISGFGIVPIGSIIAWHKSLKGIPIPPNVDVWSVLDLPDGWVECNGQTVVINNNKLPIPDLNGEGRFLRGGTISGKPQDDDFKSHIHHQGRGGGTPGSALFDVYLPDYTGDWTVNDYTEVGDTRAQGGTETRPINMSVVWIMRIK